MGRSDNGKQKYSIFGPTMFAIPFHEYSISLNFWGFVLPDNTISLLPCPWIVSSKSGSLKIKTSSLCL